MKTNAYLFLFCLLLSFTFLLQSCIKDSCATNQQFTYFTPVYSTKAAVKAGIKSSNPVSVQNPGKFYLIGKYIFLNEIDKGIHVIDNSNPADPKNISFINIPGNQDIAVSGNTLYADVYADLAVLDITDPIHINVNKFMEGVFSFRAWGGGFSPDSNKIVVDFIRHDTTLKIDCNRGGIFLNSTVYLSSAGATSPGGTLAASPIGTGGSMARFALTNSRLYTVSNSDLSVFNITNAANPEYVNKVAPGNSNIETIFPYKNKLFIGSSNGIFIYGLSDPDNPKAEGQFAHVRTCDPVIADDNFAYVTLRSGSSCGGFTNQMDVLNINDLAHPALVKSYPLTNPHGLSKDKNLLFICDGADGLKIYNATNADNILLLKQFKIGDTYDVIAANNIAILIAADGLYQFNYADVKNIQLLSKIAIGK